MSKLIICRGIPASGKSTWARAWAEEDPENRVRINRDDIRNMLGKYWVISREDIVTEIEDSAFDVAIKEGKDIVSDNMNLNPKTIQKLESLAKEKDYTIEYKDFFTPVEVCIERDSKRENPIGEKVIRDLWKKYKQDIWHREVMSKMNKLKTYDSTKTDCILVDMDGTLAFNLQGRPFYGPGTAEGIKYDAPLISTISIVRAMKMTGTCKVFIVTGRDESCREATEQWLKDYSVPFDKVFMRKQGDYRKSEVLKNEIYENNIKPFHNVLFALDDDKKCAEMYENNGLICMRP